MQNLPRECWETSQGWGRNTKYNCTLHSLDALGRVGSLFGKGLAEFFFCRIGTVKFTLNMCVKS